MEMVTLATDLPTSVKHFVHFDSLIESLNKQIANARRLRNEFEERILKQLAETGKPDTIIKINGSTLQRATRSKFADLSWSLLEEGLHTYFSTNKKPDETATILNFLQSQRSVKQVEFLKKTIPK